MGCLCVTSRDYLELIVCMDTEIVTVEKNFEGFGVEKDTSVPEDNPFANNFEVVGRHLIIKCVRLFISHLTPSKPQHHPPRSPGHGQGWGRANVGVGVRARVRYRVRLGRVQVRVRFKVEGVDGA